MFFIMRANIYKKKHLYYDIVYSRIFCRHIKAFACNLFALR